MSNKRKDFMKPNSTNINLNLNNIGNFMKIYNLIKIKKKKLNLLIIYFQIT